MTSTPPDEPFVNFHTPENSRFYAANLYFPLDRDKEDFRYLQILPGDNEDVVKCEIVRLLDDQKYEALSYCAGDPKDTREILVNGHAFNVFVSLFGALLRLRQPTESRVVWIDQICIKQNDVREREDQVMKMRVVYQNAERVVVWLGETKNGEMAINAVHELYGAYTHLLKTPGGDPLVEPEAVLTVATDYMGKLAQFDSLGRGILREVVALDQLYKTNFWSRIWIWQELIVSQSIQLLWDTVCIDSTPFFTVAHILAKVYPIGYDPGQSMKSKKLNAGTSGEADSLRRLISIGIFRCSWKRDKVLHLRDLLSKSRQAQSSDLRDRVYAVAGLANQAYNLNPDYKATIASVFCSTTWSIIATENSLDVLVDCTPPMADNVHCLPSWCPDWSKRPGNDRESLLPPTREITNSRFNASKALIGSFNFESLRRDNSKAWDHILYVDGIIVDRITELGQPWPIGLDFTVRAYREMLSPWLSILRQRRAMSEDFNVEVLRTIIIDDCGAPRTREQPGLTGFYRRSDLEYDVVKGNRRFFITENSLMGMAPPNAVPDDIICVLLGARVPFLLRKVDERYILVGEAYVSDGYMEGRAIDELERGERSTQRFAIH